MELKIFTASFVYLDIKDVRNHLFHIKINYQIGMTLHLRNMEFLTHVT